jgi:prevent-host-death family protein
MAKERRVGIREAKAKLSHFVALAKQGEDVVLTERGAPVARLVAFPSKQRTEQDVLEELAALGLSEPATGPVVARRPIRGAAGVSVSAVVRAMRR